MGAFNWKHLGGQAYRSLIRTKATHRQLTGHRIRVLLVFWFLFIPHQLITWICLGLDNLFFPGWRHIQVEKPIFIVGPFRSGTTFFHRLIAVDKKHFTTMKTWEIYLAPSILQRRFLHFITRIDRLVGAPIMRSFQRYNKRHLDKIRFHKVGLWKEEEDEGLMLFLWDSLFTWYFFPDYKGIASYQFSHVGMNPRRKEHRFRFYRSCLQRHLYCHPESASYLSKNPAFTPYIADLKKIFPDAHFVYMMRDPKNTLLSQSSLFSFAWHYFASPLETYPFRAEILAMASSWYKEALDFLPTWDNADYLIIEYKNLIKDPLATIHNFYAHFKRTLDKNSLFLLEKKLQETGKHEPINHSSLEEMGYDPKQVQEEFSSVYKKFHF